MDVHTREQRSFNMSQVKSKNTRPEKVMFSMLNRSALKFKKHYKILGKPDIAFPDNKLVVFINGEFWHGKNFDSYRNSISEFWVKKINQNIRRDRSVQRILRIEGWHIINFWGKYITRNPDKSFNRLESFLKKLRSRK